MSPIEKRLKSSIGMGAVNGDSFERSVCAKQMAEAADEITHLRAQLKAKERELKDRESDISEALEFIINGFYEEAEEILRSRLGVASIRVGQYRISEHLGDAHSDPGHWIEVAEGEATGEGMQTHELPELIDKFYSEKF